MRRIVIAGSILFAIAALSLGKYATRPRPFSPLITAAASGSPPVRAVLTTGTLQAATTVQVGTEVSGIIHALGADFNSIVRKGQMLAELDRSTFEADLRSAQAALTQAQADRELAKVTAADAYLSLTRATALRSKELIPSSDFDAANVAAAEAAAGVKNADAEIAQATAAVNQAVVNLNHTLIRSPIDGIVVARNVDVGQTVAASVQTPVLFLVAADLAHMQLHATIDETDVGGVHTGDGARFSVDAYPNAVFHGVVSQVRLQPLEEAPAGAAGPPTGPAGTPQPQAGTVVAYEAIIDVVNPHNELRPGMTATIALDDHTL
jgi:HlyD family secretion protein